MFYSWLRKPIQPIRQPAHGCLEGKRVCHLLRCWSLCLVPATYILCRNIDCSRSRPSQDYIYWEIDPRPGQFILRIALIWQTLTNAQISTINQPPVLQRTPDMVITQEIKKKFLSSPNFAVVGASKDQSKFGTKVSASLVVLPAQNWPYNDE